jgi:multiple sugar transport system ATP-binding protein
VAEIVLDGVTKEFSGGVKAVNDVSLHVEDGEFMVLVGPSGCGKSTLLRIIAGLEETTDGRVEIGGRDVTDLAPRRRDIAMVFQSYALYPHMTVRENLGYGLKVRRTSKAERKERVERVAELLRLEDMLDRRPAALSGGQRQRVAMGRAIVREPKAFLMDEPLSNLDAKLRVGMRAQLTALHARLGTTVVYVTHDQVEAMTLGQRVAVMRDGRVQQVETPQRLYADPGNVFVASFIGSPAMNLVEARFDGEALLFAGHRLPVPPADRPAVPGGTPVILGMRPETLGVAAEQPGAPTLDVEVAVVEDLGSDAHAIFIVDAPPVQADGDRRDDGALLTEGTPFTARIPAHLQPRAGDRIRLAARPDRFHYFDVETGEKLPRRSTATAPPATPPTAQPAAVS